MYGETDIPRLLKKWETVLLFGALLTGVAATLRSFGVDSVTAPARALLSAAALLALIPLIRLTARTGLNGEAGKTLLIIIFFCHLIATLFFFPPEDLLNSRPVITLDHAIHYYQVVRGTEIFPETLKLHAYDPYFMAGYPGGTLFDIDSKGVELWCALMRFIGTARAYKTFIFMGYLLFMFTLYSACRRLGYSLRESIYALLVSLLFWHWGRPYAGAFRYAGMFAYLAVSHLSLYIGSLFRSFLRGKALKKFFIFGPLAFFLHPTAAVLLTLPFITVFLLEIRTQKSKEEKWLRPASIRFLGWCLLVLAVNAVWLVPLLKYMDVKTASQTFFQIEGGDELARLLFRPGNLPALFLLLLAVTGFISLFRSGRFTEAFTPAMGSLFLFIVAAYGTGIPLLNQMEPGRFLVPAIIFAAPLAGAGLDFTVNRAGDILSSAWMIKTVNTAAVVIPIILIPFLGMTTARAYYRYTLSTTHTPETARLIEALREHTEPDGRLMFENGLPIKYGFCYLSSIIPLYTGVEQIGGPYPHVFIKHNFTNFAVSATMGATLNETGHEEMKDYLRVYNVRWILTASDEAESYFYNFPNLKVLWSSSDFTLRENTVYSRRIEIKSDYNRVDISFPPDSPVPEEIMLPYHWDRSLKVSSSAELEPQFQLDDPVPFILLKPNDERKIEIRYD